MIPVMTQTKFILDVNDRACDIVSGQQESHQMHSLRKMFETSGDKDKKKSFALTESFLAEGGFLNQTGFRKQTCAACDICIPIRADAQAFLPTPEQRRVLDNNTDLRLTLNRGLDLLTARWGDNEYTPLFQRYRQAVFGDDAIFDVPSFFDSYDTVFGMTPFHLDARDLQGRLVACSVLHVAQKSAYGTVHFYEPEQRQTQIGLHMMFNTIRAVRDAGLSYLYLGHWTRQPSRYSWKDKMEPIELLIDGQWTPQKRSDLRSLRNGQAAYPTQRALGVSS